MKDHYGYPLLFSSVTRVATYRGYIMREINLRLFLAVTSRRVSSAVSSDLLRYIQFDVAAEDQRLGLNVSMLTQYYTSVYLYQTIIAFRESDPNYSVPNGVAGVQNLRW
jgi:hypothetical protein